jgi:hypothetical protein
LKGLVVTNLRFTCSGYAASRKTGACEAEITGRDGGEGPGRVIGGDTTPPPPKYSPLFGHGRRSPSGPAQTTTASSPSTSRPSTGSKPKAGAGWWTNGNSGPRSPTTTGSTVWSAAPWPPRSRGAVLFGTDDRPRAGRQRMELSELQRSRRQMSNNSPQCPDHEVRGLQCRQCGCQHFRVIYTWIYRGGGWSDAAGVAIAVDE